MNGTPVEWVRSAELRYGGQTWEVEVDVPGGPVERAHLLEAFESEHERLYGVRGEPGSPIEIRALRVAALGPATTADRLSGGDGKPRGGTMRATSLGDVPVRSRSSVGESREAGPLLVDEYDTTVVVRDGWTVRRDAPTETLVLERAA